uniref:Uncharacterized protein n=1 Tax=Graphocephala atropunctata TaxID=36148 RepID=A0A1B6ML53_9HEMI
MSTIHISSNNRMPTTFTHRHFNKDTMLHFKEVMASQSWDETLKEECADMTYSRFITLVMANLDLTCPYKAFRKKSSNQNIAKYDMEVREMKKAFTEAHNKFIRSGQLEDKA